MKSINHVAVVAAAVVFFAIGAGWYTVFQQPWLAGIGKTVDQLARENGGSPLPFIVGFIAVLIMCYTLGWIVQRGLTRSAGNGALTGATVGFGIVGAALALYYGFEARGITLWLINAGYVLVGLVISGAIIGGWRQKDQAES